ncbi:MAG TPA: ABC transporter substrate-binding protein, partial [Chthonomonadales bacterium]|nr:ABC transporter substrate-binding protein [Chthonomonadales bacterium]
MNIPSRKMVALAAIPAAALILGCPKPKAAAPTGGGASPSGKISIAVIPKATSHSYWLSVKAGADAAGRAAGVDIHWLGPSEETGITEQINILQSQVTSGVQGVVLAATDSHALIRPVQDAIAKGVKVVTVDSGLAEPISLCYIATDNVEGGRLAADALAKAIGGKGKVGVLAYLKGAASNDQREQGFNEEIRKYPGIRVVSTLYTDSEAAKAGDQTTNMLTANPDIAGIFAANEPNGVGAAGYLRQARLAGKVKMVAFDSSPDEINALKDGTIQALIVQNPYEMGFQGVNTVLKAIRGEPITQKFIDSGVTVVTMQNLNDPKVQKLV